MDGLMRSAEVARRISMSRALVAHHIKAGHLKHSEKVGGVPMFTREDVARFLAERIEQTEKSLAELRERHESLTAA